MVWEEVTRWRERRGMADTRVAAVTLCFNEETMSRRQHSGLGLRRCSSAEGRKTFLEGSQLILTQSQEGRGRQGKDAGICRKEACWLVRCARL